MVIGIPTITGLNLNKLLMIDSLNFDIAEYFLTKDYIIVFVVII